jgi:hypothetical protein
VRVTYLSVPECGLEAKVELQWGYELTLLELRRRGQGVNELVRLGCVFRENRWFGRMYDLHAREDGKGEPLAGACYELREECYSLVVRPVAGYTGPSRKQLPYLLGVLVSHESERWYRRLVGIVDPCEQKAPSELFGDRPVSWHVLFFFRLAY